MPTQPSGRPPGPNSTGPHAKTSRVRDCTTSAKGCNVVSNAKQQQHYTRKASKKNNTPEANNRENSQHRHHHSKQRHRMKKSIQRRKEIEEEIAYLDSLLQDQEWASAGTKRQHKHSNGKELKQVKICDEHRKQVNQPVNKIWLALQPTQKWQAQQKILFSNNKHLPAKKSVTFPRKHQQKPQSLAHHVLFRSAPLEDLYLLRMISNHQQVSAPSH